MRARLVLASLAAAALLVVGLAAPAQAAPPSYVALGDSYSSGVGTRSYLNDGSTCQRSVYAYPSLIAAAKGYALNFRACSGATVADVTNSQLSALSAADAYVTISVGGNDAGFASVLTTCALPSWLSNCTGAVNGAQGYIRNTLPGSLATLYASIRAKAPSAKVVVVGYPRIFNGTDCNLLTWFSGSEMTRLNQTADQLDSTIAAADRVSGVRFRQPRARLHRPRRLRPSGVDQRALVPDQRVVPPEPQRTGLGLHPAGEPGPRRRCGGRHTGGLPEGRGVRGPVGRAAAVLRRPGRDDHPEAVPRAEPRDQPSVIGGAQPGRRMRQNG